MTAAVPRISRLFGKVHSLFYGHWLLLEVCGYGLIISIGDFLPFFSYWDVFLSLDGGDGVPSPWLQYSRNSIKTTAAPHTLWKSGGSRYMYSSHNPPSFLETCRMTLSRIGQGEIYCTGTERDVSGIKE